MSLRGIDSFVNVTNREKAAWPAKLLDADIPTYIVPILPQWAANLFDTNLADQTLFGAPREPALSREKAYYRARYPDPPFEAPGRILWYVSSGSGRHPGAKAIRACSVLECVTIAKPGELFRKYARLGIYSWRNVLETAKGDTDRHIMGLHFSDTELFARPIPWKEMQATLYRHGVSTTLVSPIRITPELFAIFYQSGISQPKKRDSQRLKRTPSVNQASIREPHHRRHEDDRT